MRHDTGVLREGEPEEGGGAAVATPPVPKAPTPEEIADTVLAKFQEAQRQQPPAQPAQAPAAPAAPVADDDERIWKEPTKFVKEIAREEVAEAVKKQANPSQNSALVNVAIREAAQSDPVAWDLLKTEVYKLVSEQVAPEEHVDSMVWQRAFQMVKGGRFNEVSEAYAKANKQRSDAAASVGGVTPGASKKAASEDLSAEESRISTMLGVDPAKYKERKQEMITNSNPLATMLTTSTKHRRGIRGK